MPLGTFGSTLNDELNRLANGGTYPAITAYKDQAGAAQAWAATRSIALGNITDLVGVLNYIAGITNPKDMLALAGVCNYIAGTYGLEASAALGLVAS